MDFASPRFRGDPLLESILNDPDMGTNKLGPGSAPESVLKVQQALFDLGWTTRIIPPVSDPASFVIGDYGPLTTSTVLAYKTHYDIHFPPDEPTGFVDGFTGPRTLSSLDGHCVLLDAGVAAVDATATVVAAASATDAVEAATLVVDASVQRYVDEALTRKNGNAWEAWLDLTSMREGNCADVDLAVAEHYTFARGVVAQQGIPPAVVVAWVVAYASFKLTGPGRLLKTGSCGVTPASAAQVAWGIRGTCDGAADLLL